MSPGPDEQDPAQHPGQQDLGGQQNPAEGELTLIGRIRSASNATFLGRIDGAVVVYKPVAGETPLWDFPGATLAHRELAAFLISQALGWEVVPETWLREGPHGVGMVQRWQQPDEDLRAVDLLPSDEVRPRAGGGSWRVRTRRVDVSRSSTRTPPRCGGWRYSTSWSTTPTARATTCSPCPTGTASAWTTA